MPDKNSKHVVDPRLFKAYPLLAFLTEQQTDSVDLNVLWMPTLADQTLIDDLSAELNQYVVIYNRDYEPQKAHLCRMIKAAMLDSDQVKAVQAIEQRLIAKNKIVVVYERPVVFNSPEGMPHA
ncbi:hypothetical protein [Chryseolinea lacunae]|uniref:Uncharacterized protein n=1 Tax=Chryseolinea lacunae TaxID=2801331 RepID=A0ABS1KZ06_9BACT|nr:hypothetical protein [Chryseolinea lacunae]MBL0744690.1 hypothetical protein [Chryseolinea lacunae]